MRARIWGCRGSLATPGPDTVRYGGNTSCVQVTLDDGTSLILDAGTGIRELGLQPEFQAAGDIHLLLSHLHLDHLEGLGFFQPLWNPDVRLHIWGPASPIKSLEQRIARYLSPPLFPIHLSEVPSSVVFHDTPEGEFALGSARIYSQPVSHQGAAVGYRIDDVAGSIAYLPDHEPAIDGDLATMDPSWMSGHGIAHGVDVLLHDSQYTEAEYESRVGWGHSSVEQVVTFARVADCKRLVMFHHDPLHNDDALDTKQVRARELWGSDGFAPVLARDGMRIDLSHAEPVPAG